MNKQQIKEFFVTSNGFTKKEGFALNTQEMNPGDYEEIFFAGKSLDEAIKDYYREVTFYAYQPSNGIQIFENVDSAIEYIEDNGEITFDKFIKAHKSLSNSHHKNFTVRENSPKSFQDICKKHYRILSEDGYCLECNGYPFGKKGVKK